MHMHTCSAAHVPRSLTHLPTHPLTHPPTHPPTSPLTHPPTHLTYSTWYMQLQAILSSLVLQKTVVFPRQVGACSALIAECTAAVASVVGHAGVGRTGWHIDGSFMAKPFAYSTYHIVSCPSQAGTLPCPLNRTAPPLHAHS